MFRRGFSRVELLVVIAVIAFVYGVFPFPQYKLMWEKQHMPPTAITAAAQPATPPAEPFGQRTPATPPAEPFGQRTTAPTSDEKLMARPNSFSDGSVSSDPAKNFNPPTEAERKAWVKRDTAERNELKRQMWWADESNIVGKDAKSIPDRISATPENPTIALMSDRKIGENPVDQSTSYVAPGAATISVNVGGLHGAVAFKPLSYINAYSLWTASIDGCAATTKKIGDFQLVRLPSGAEQVILSCQFTPPAKPTMGAADRCGIEEVVFLSGK